MPPLGRFDARGTLGVSPVERSIRATLERFATGRTLRSTLNIQAII
jgi:hypothetical protein